MHLMLVLGKVLTHLFKESSMETAESVFVLWVFKWCFASNFPSRILSIISKTRYSRFC